MSGTSWYYNKNCWIKIALCGKLNVDGALQKVKKTTIAEKQFIGNSIKLEN